MNDDDDWVLADVLAWMRHGNHVGEVASRLVENRKSTFIGFVLFKNPFVGNTCLLQLHFVVLNRLLVSSINGSRGHSVDLCAILLSQLVVLLLLSLDAPLHICQQVIIYLDEHFVAFQGLGEISTSPFLLELFDLGPQLVRDLLLWCESLDRHGKAQLRQEAI